MKNIFLLLLFISFANSANLLTHNIYERTDRIDIMLSFDSPYEGKITQRRGKNITTLILSDLNYDKLIEKNINSNILQAIAIEPKKDNIHIILKSKNNIAVIASKALDGFGLRIRTKPIRISQQNKASINASGRTKTPLSTKPSEDLVDGRYLSVILLLCVMILFMFWLKKRVIKKSEKLKSQKSWLFKSNSTTNKQQEKSMYFTKRK